MILSGLYCDVDTFMMGERADIRNGSYLPERLIKGKKQRHG